LRLLRLRMHDAAADNVNDGKQLELARSPDSQPALAN
jgi:hypothetical protein